MAPAYHARVADNGADTDTRTRATGPGAGMVDGLSRAVRTLRRAATRTGDTSPSDSRTLSGATGARKTRVATSQVAEDRRASDDVVTRALAEYDAGAGAELREGSRAMRAPDPLAALRSRLYRESLSRADSCARSFEVHA